MPIVGERKETLLMNCATALEVGRGVTITKSTNVVAYTTTAVKPDAITVSRAIARDSGYTIEVILVSNITGSRFVEIGADVACGADLAVGSDGKFITQALTAVSSGLFAYGAGKSGELIGAYRA